MLFPDQVKFCVVAVRLACGIWTVLQFIYDVYSIQQNLLWNNYVSTVSDFNNTWTNV